jgi:hypothetical protein
VHESESFPTSGNAAHIVLILDRTDAHNNFPVHAKADELDRELIITPIEGTGRSPRLDHRMFGRRQSKGWTKWMAETFRILGGSVVVQQPHDGSLRDEMMLAWISFMWDLNQMLPRMTRQAIKKSELENRNGSRTH